MAGRVRGFGRRPAAGHPACRPGCASAATVGEDSSSPEACGHHAGDAGRAWLHGELPEVLLCPNSAPNGRCSPLGGVPCL
eukprot:5429300-Alexandrium_andersonii.AAC.1